MEKCYILRKSPRGSINECILITHNGDGTFDYDPDGQFGNLGVGQQATDIFTYTISDGHGGTESATVTITINGTTSIIYLPLIIAPWNIEISGNTYNIYSS